MSLSLDHQIITKHLKNNTIYPGKIFSFRILVKHNCYLYLNFLVNHVCAISIAVLIISRHYPSPVKLLQIRRVPIRRVCFKYGASRGSSSKYEGSHTEGQLQIRRVPYGGSRSKYGESRGSSCKYEGSHAYRGSRSKYGGSALNTN